MNRADRHKAIEKRVEQCKNDADQKSAAAQSAATQAQQEKSSLDKLRAAGESTRADLENQKSSLTTQAAQQAAQTVRLQSEIDAKNQQWPPNRLPLRRRCRNLSHRVPSRHLLLRPPQPVRSPADANAVPAGADSASVHAITAVHAPDSGRHPSLYGRPRAHRTAITGMHTQQASARGGPMSVASRWASARHRISVTAASGGVRPRRTGCASTIALRSGPLCRSCRGRRAPRAMGSCRGGRAGQRQQHPHLGVECGRSVHHHIPYAV